MGARPTPMELPTCCVRLALRYDPRPDPAADDVADLYAGLLHHAVVAEAEGVDLVWVSERPFVAGSRIPAALPLCAALVARTRRLRVGAGPLTLPLHHPLRVAEDAATLDGLSGGRFELALGLGAGEEAFTGYGVSTQDRGERLEEGVALLRAAFTGDPITFAGRHHDVSDVAVSPRPVQAGGPPLWIGAGADTAVRRVARLGAGLLARTAAAIDLYRHEIGRGGRAALELDVDEALDASRREELLEAARGCVGFDLVIAAGDACDGFLPPRRLRDLLVLRDALAAALE